MVYFGISYACFSNVQTVPGRIQEVHHSDDLDVVKGTDVDIRSPAVTFLKIIIQKNVG